MMRLKSRKESPHPVVKLFMGGVYTDVFFPWIFSGCLFFTPQIAGRISVGSYGIAQLMDGDRDTQLERGFHGTTKVTDETPWDTKW